MKEEIEQIKEQIHDIRNLLGPLDLMLEHLDNQIKKQKVEWECKI